MPSEVVYPPEGERGRPLRRRDNVAKRRSSGSQCQRAGLVGGGTGSGLFTPVASLTARRLTQLPPDTRPLPSVQRYEELLRLTPRSRG